MYLADRLLFRRLWASQLGMSHPYKTSLLRVEDARCIQFYGLSTRSWYRLDVVLADPRDACSEYSDSLACGITNNSYPWARRATFSPLVELPVWTRCCRKWRKRRIPTVGTIRRAIQLTRRSRTWHAANLIEQRRPRPNRCAAQSRRLSMPRTDRTELKTNELARLIRGPSRFGDFDREPASPFLAVPPPRRGTVQTCGNAPRGSGIHGRLAVSTDTDRGRWRLDRIRHRRLHWSTNSVDPFSGS